MEELQKKLIEHYRKEDHLEEGVAKSFVNTHFVGMRVKRGQTILAISPKAVEWLENYPWLDTENEKTAGDLSRSYGGAPRAWSQRINRLRQELIGDIAATKILSPDETEAFVDDRFVGMRRRQGALPSLAVTKAAERYLPLYDSLPEGWITGSQLAKEKGGSSVRWNQAIEAVRENQIRLLSDQASGNERAATEEVDATIAGKRRIPVGGPPSWAINKEYVKELEPYYNPTRFKPPGEGKKGR
jgi:hypothetical protein